jgi:tetratricopeptide (TPR) repeat protein
VTAALVVAWAFAPPPAVAAPTPTPAPASTAAVVVGLPPGTALPPGRYDVVISGAGTRVVTTISVPGAVAPGPSGGGARHGSRAGLLASAALGLATGGVAAAAVLAFRRRRTAGRPRRRPDGPDPAERLRSYHAALRLVEAGGYQEALPQLTRLEAKLPDDLRTEAGFYIAFVLYQLLYLDEAEHRLAALHREDPRHLDVAYLLAYLRVQRRDYDGAELVLAGIAGQGELTGTRRKLYGIVLYQRALAALRDGNVDEAVELFDRVIQLGDLADRVPTHLRDRHVILGTRALVDRDVTAARSNFERLEQVAGGLAADRRGDLLASARLGLALAAWIDEDYENVDPLLVEAIRAMHPAAVLEAPWPPPGAMEDPLREVARGVVEGVRDPRDRALRDMHFLRGIAVLRAGNGDGAGRGAGTAFPAEAVSRFACARALDPTFADVYLVVGLLYVRLGDPAQRAEGVAMLREARKRGASDPELIRLLSGDDTGGDRGRLLDLIDGYLDDPTVRDAIREELRRQRSRFGRPRERDQRPDTIRAGTAEPTVAEMSDRADLLVARVRLLGGAAAGGASRDAVEATEELARASQLLLAQARTVERCEQSVLDLIGDSLLTDLRGE